MPLPWFEHGLSRPQRDVLTNYTTVASVIGFFLALIRIQLSTKSSQQTYEKTPKLTLNPLNEEIPLLAYHPF